MIWRKADNKGVEQCEELIWQALLVIWMWSMDVLMGDLEEDRQQRSEVMANWFGAKITMGSPTI